MSGRSHEDLDDRLQHRMLFFTDAVFAIVMTLLVLELRPPEPHEALDGNKLFAFALSFAIIAIFWLAHLATTRRLAQFDWPVAVANLVFLFPICLIPFVSGWVGEDLNTIPGWIAYSLVLVVTSSANVAIVLLESRGAGRLLAGGVTRRERLYRMGRAASPGLAWAVGLCGALAGKPIVPLMCWVLIPVFITLVRLAVGPKRATQAA
jgi:uncharacterized membrane protein